MLESIKYVVTFNTTGRTLKNDIIFKPGITVIKGENESGKSFVLEMIRYALFGSDALRGLRSEYERLDVTLKIEVKGKKYSIVRKGSKATVNINEAVGTSATNKYVRKVLGFGLEVFDISNNANQGELDKLTKDMGPTERRRIIDEVTGLNQFEAAEKECRQQATEFRKVAEALEAQLVDPVEPQKPDAYEPSSKLKVRLDMEIRNQTMRDTFEEMDEPVAPTPPEGSNDAIEHEEKRGKWVEHQLYLMAKLVQLPEIDDEYSREELERFRESLGQSLRGLRPTCPREQLLQWREDHAIRTREAEPVYCGECGALVTGKPLPVEPALSLAEIDEEMARHDKWAGHNYRSDLPTSPLTGQQIEQRIAAYDSAGARADLEKEIAELGDEPEDRSIEAYSWAKYAEDLKAYDRERHSYANYLHKKQIVDSLPAPEPFLQETYEMALRYETLMSRYEATVEIYDDQKKRLELVKTKHEGFKRGSAALKDARSEVKRYLVPSLSRVASQLLVEMTDGERRHIFIDENFDIWVDKQPVRTLSGSGVSVVNLALRVALGQVLTQSVIPIFLADEIDANMAEKRTLATHASLNRLKSKLKQIIVVTHKEMEGDQTLCLT